MQRSHGLSGLAAGFAAGWLAPSVGLGLLCGLLGAAAAWLPDLDHPSGRPARVLGPITWVLCRLIRALSRLVGLPAHRGISHTLVAAVGAGLLGGAAAAVWLPPSSALVVGAAVGGGYLAALAGDWVTRASLPHLLWPVCARTPGPPKWMRISTGKQVERFAVVPLLSVACLVSAGLVLGVWR